jgi:1,4-alpha-glucan branching enzyme
MGAEVGQEREWSHERSVDWHLLADPDHAAIGELLSELNRVLRSEPSLYARDAESDGFSWIDASDVDSNVLSFMRLSAGGRPVVCVANLSPVVREGYRVGLPRGGRWIELLNTDDRRFGGSGVVNGTVEAAPSAWHGRDWSVELTLPPLGVVWLAPA